MSSGKALASDESHDLISTLHTRENYLYQYQGFWYYRPLPGIISCQKDFEVQNSDIFLATLPKSGTTWLKAIMFTLVNRKRYPVGGNDAHPLHTYNPHDLVPVLESMFCEGIQIPDIALSSSPRLFCTHLSHGSLPESVKNSSTCKLVYLCRNPKDNFVSLWHFSSKLKLPRIGTKSIGEVFEMFCKGKSPSGPFWDHVLQYWEQSKENPNRVFFLKYEDMKEQPTLHLRRLAEFLDCPFSADEEESGLVEQILKLCSFDSLSALEVNQSGKVESFGIESNAFFRQGGIGDWKNHLSTEMVEKIDQITQDKFYGSGLVL